MRSTYFNCRYILEISIFLHRFDSTQVKQISFFLNGDPLHARLNSHYKAWSHKKKKRRNMNLIYESQVEAT